MISTGLSSNLPILPIIIPMITAVIMMFGRKNIPMQKAVSGISSILMVIASFYLLYFVRENGQIVYLASDWSAPFGIVLTMDLLSCIMVVLSSIVSCLALFYSFYTNEEEVEKQSFYIVWNFIIMGVNGSFITGDLFNLFVFFEIMLMSSYVLLVLGSSKGQLRETFKYLIINILSSTLFLIALGVLYAMIGSLNMADIAQKIATVENQNLITVMAMLFMVVFGLKGALFPLYFWLPQSYTQPTAAVSALFAGLLTKVGVYVLIRIFTLIFIWNTGFTHTVLLVIAGGTMIFGIIGAVSRNNYKEVLSYNLISHVGYMIMGLALYSVWSIAGAIYYIAHHIIVKSCLFLTEGVVSRITGTSRLDKMSGLLKQFPALGFGFLVAALSLAGVPPLSGFFPKLMLMQDAISQESYIIFFVAIVVSFLTLFSLIKIFINVFWGEEKGIQATQKDFNYKAALVPIFILIGLSVAMGIGAQPMLELAVEASEQIMNPEYYIDVVMSIEGGR